MKRKCFVRATPLKNEAILNITAMASIFTVLLVFILKSLSTSVSSITPAKGVVLPQVKSGETLNDAIRVEVSSDSIIVGDKPIIKLNNFDFNSSELSYDGSLNSLNKALHFEKGETPLTKEESKILLVADHNTPYALLKRIFASVSNQELETVNLVVVEGKD